VPTYEIYWVVDILPEPISNLLPIGVCLGIDNNLFNFLNANSSYIIGNTIVLILAELGGMMRSSDREPPSTAVEFRPPVQTAA